ncbi:MAG: pyridoxine 5'-phosphate synthase [Verrucomicrobia bacterium]|nr:pyridoxine 5'-phosphate synthase [Verrucomicrobiota bacterium]
MQSGPLKLGVNIDHVATVRQARRVAYPDVVQAARLCEAAGAQGITVHLREDRRHIQDADVRALRACIQTRLNLEMAVAPEIVRIACDVRPDEACLVPERRAELTTEGGLDVAGNRAGVGEAVRALAECGILVSLFIDPEISQLDAAHALGAPCVELHTGAYCDATGDAAARELERLIQAARHGHALGLQVNAGHGINLENVAGILQMPHLDTLNIGHSIVAHAVMVGLPEAVRAMLGAMAGYQGGRREAGI